jgi:hypothetical protein
MLERSGGRTTEPQDIVNGASVGRYDDLNPAERS